MLWRGHDLGALILLGYLRSLAQGLLENAKYNCKAPAEQQRMVFAASTTSLGWFVSGLHVQHIGTMGCFLLMCENENTWKNPNSAGQDSLIKESCVFRHLPLFSALPLLFNSSETHALIQTPGLFLSGNHIKHIAWPSSFAKLITVLSSDPKTLGVR